METWTSRTELLLGKEGIDKLSNKRVLVVGVGGVGAYAAEMICRAGVGKITIIDGDVVNPSNINRQLIATHSVMGKAKVDLMKARLLDINPELEIHAYQEFLRDARTLKILQEEKYDYVVDAIDTLSPKVFLVYHAKSLGIPVISSMGAGGKTDPTKLLIKDISKTYNCGLAKAVRKRLSKLGVKKGIKTVFSTENVDPNAVKEVQGEENKKSILGTISYLPAVFGCTIASVVIKDLLAQD